MGKKLNNKITPIKKAFGMKVRMRRYELEMTQEELAEKANLHPTYISSIEKGERNIGLESIVSIAKALKIPIHELIPN